MQLVSWPFIIIHLVKTTPSQQDIQLTHRLVEVGELLGIKLLDHLIIGDGTFTSLKEKGYL